MVKQHCTKSIKQWGEKRKCYASSHLMSGYALAIFNALRNHKVGLIFFFYFKQVKIMSCFLYIACSFKCQLQWTQCSTVKKSEG